MRTKLVAIREKRKGLEDLELLASEMARLATKEGDDYDRFSERIRLNIERITGKSIEAGDIMHLTKQSDRSKFSE